MSDFLYSFGVIVFYMGCFLGACVASGTGIAMSIEEGGKKWPALAVLGVLLLCAGCAAAASGLELRGAQ